MGTMGHRRGRAELLGRFLRHVSERAGGRRGCSHERAEDVQRALGLRCGDFRRAVYCAHPAVVSVSIIHGMTSYKKTPTPETSQRLVNVTAELTSPSVLAAWLRAAVEAPEGAAWLVSWV